MLVEVEVRVVIHHPNSSDMVGDPTSEFAHETYAFSISDVEQLMKLVDDASAIVIKNVSMCAQSIGLEVR